MNLILYPVLINMFGAILALCLYQYQTLQKFAALLVNICFLLVAIVLAMEVDANGIQVINIGSWSAPFGITFVADRFASMMVVVVAIIAVCCSLYLFGYPFGGPKNSRDFKFFTAFFHLLMTGVSGAFLTGDLFNLFVMFEILLLASFVLMVMGNRRTQLEGGLKYITINLISSTFFLVGIGLFYGKVGALNIASIALRLQEGDQGTGALITGIFFIISFAIKAALFPFNFWLPASYHQSHPLTTALFASLLTKVGVYAILRFFPLIFITQKEIFQTLLIALTGLTMITGVFGAVSDMNVRRIFSFQVIAQIGYMVLGIALYTPLSIAATVFCFIHHIITKAALFVSSGHLILHFGHDDLKKMGGLYRLNPWQSLVFLVPALSLAGIPPLSGFFSKFFIFQAAYEAQSWGMLIIGIAVAILTLYCMIKIWIEAYWKVRPADIEAEFPMRPDVPIGPKLSSAFLALALLLVGVFAGPLFDLSMKAAEELMNPTLYIEAVLGVQS